MNSEYSANLSAEQIYPTIVFVTHGGPLEAKSALLAASLAEYYLPGRILSRQMLPEDVHGAISDETAELFQMLGVETRPGANEIDLNYKHGNKLTSLQGVDGPAIFLDSDMLLMCPFSWHYCFNSDASVKPADIDTFSAGGGSWSQVWKLFGRKPPAHSYTATLTHEKMRPYFNAGFIYAKNGDALSRAWLDAARKIDAEPKVENKRPWLDQIALPVALEELGWKVRELDIAFNFPNHLSSMSGGFPYIAHYHFPKIIAEDERLFFRTNWLLRKHPLLVSILSKYEEWSPVMDRYNAESELNNARG